MRGSTRNWVMWMKHLHISDLYEKIMKSNKLDWTNVIEKTMQSSTIVQMGYTPERMPLNPIYTWEFSYENQTYTTAKLQAPKLDNCNIVLKPIPMWTKVMEFCGNPHISSTSSLTTKICLVNQPFWLFQNEYLEFNI